MLSPQYTRRTVWSPYLQAAGLGAIAGIRSMWAPAIASTYLNKDAPAENELSISSPIVALLHLLALGEMVSDKLPFIPERTSALPLIGRGLSGALVGGLVFASQRESLIIGALVGSGAAVASTYLSYAVRQLLTEQMHIPLAVAGMVEDMAVLSMRKALLPSA
ncbi:MAG: hypothetical protein HC914_18975 [Chloroflexaceae bacterium]|nr:hypothetical protein [Chloroflexaceae bacterium]